MASQCPLLAVLGVRRYVHSFGLVLRPVSRTAILASVQQDGMHEAEREAVERAVNHIQVNILTKYVYGFVRMCLTEIYADKSCCRRLASSAAKLFNRETVRSHSNTCALQLLQSCTDMCS